MSILKVAKLGNPVLREIAKPIPLEEIKNLEIQRLIQDMIETMREYEGVGLAAPQVHKSLQICVIESIDRSKRGRRKYHSVNGINQSSSHDRFREST